MPQPWPMIDPGAMVHKVTIFENVIIEDPSGTSTEWRALLTTWAQIDPVRGTEVLKAGSDTTQLYLTVKIYWQQNIKPTMRVDSLNGSYLIQSIENLGERNIVLVLNCLALGTSL